MSSPYVTIATLLVAALLVLPLFSLSVENVLFAVETFTALLGGLLEPTTQIFEIVVRSAASVIVLVLLLLSVLLVNARSYAFALAIAVVFLDGKLITDAAMLLPLAALSFLEVVRSGWRKNQISSIGSLTPIASAVMLSFALLAFFLLVAWLLSSKTWSYAEAARNLKVDSPLLAVFIDLLFRNPIGLTFVLGVIIFAIYSFSKDVAESLVIFLRPSPQSALKSLRELVDFNAPISPPLTSLRNALVSLAISPPIYYMITLLLARPDLQLPPPYDSVLRFVTAAQIFTIVWFFISRLTASFEEREPSLLSTFVGLASVVIVYLILYLAALWHPEYGISVERADEVLRKAILSYYETVLYMGELLLTFMGVAP